MPRGHAVWGGGEGRGHRCRRCHPMKGRNPRSGSCRPRTREGVAVGSSGELDGEQGRCSLRARVRVEAGTDAAVDIVLEIRRGKETRSPRKDMRWEEEARKANTYI